jgi:Trk K+ transport system NAD-binding subunit
MSGNGALGDGCNLLARLGIDDAESLIAFIGNEQNAAYALAQRL